MIKRKQRIPICDLSTMKAEDREAIEKNAMNGQVFNIFKVMANHPALTKRWTPFAGHILFKQTLPFRDRELLILRIGWLNQAEYEFAQHELIAKRAVSAMPTSPTSRKGPRPRAGTSTRQRSCSWPTTSSRTRSVSDATWATLSKTYSTEQLMDAVFTVGQYNLVSWALNSFGVPLDDFLPGAQKK